MFDYKNCFSNIEYRPGDCAAMERIVDHFETDLNKIIELVLAMPDDQHKKEFIQVNNTIRLKYYHLYLREGFKKQKQKLIGIFQLGS